MTTKLSLSPASRGSTNTMISQRSDAAAPIRLRLPSLQSCTRMSGNLHGCRRRLHRRSADCTECAQDGRGNFTMKCWRWLRSAQKSFTADAWKSQKKYGVELLVCSSLNRNSGTMVREKPKWKNVNQRRGCRQNVAKSVLQGLGNDPESTFRLLNLLDRNNLNIDVMIQSLGKDGTKSVSLYRCKAGYAAHDRCAERQ